MPLEELYLTARGLVGVAQAAGVAVALYAFSAAAAARLKLAPWLALATGAAALACAGMVQFWAMAMTPAAGAPLRVAILVAVAALALDAWSRRDAADRELLWPCALAFGGAVFVLAALYVDRGADEPGWPDWLRMAASRWTHPLPGDNEIPYVFADVIRLGQMPTPFYGDWLSSDRPPLQTGLYLLFSIGDRHVLTYQAIAVALQTLVAPATWALARAIGVANRTALIAAVGVLFMPLVIQHAGFVWPKLIAAAFLALAIAIHFAKPFVAERPALVGAVAGACGGAAMLGHGATAFAALGCGVAALLTGRLNGVRYLAAALATAFALYGPWMAYQRFYDPPGDRLMKWHLAGVVPIDDRGLVETLRESYGALTPDAWTQGRALNVRTLVASPAPALEAFASGSGSLHERVVALRNAAFYQVPLSLGVFALALYALPLFLLWRATRPLALATGLSLAAWALLIFEPGQTIPHQGSMFPQLALAVLAARAATTHRWAGLLLAALVGVQALSGIWLYGLS